MSDVIQFPLPKIDLSKNEAEEIDVVLDVLSKWRKVCGGNDADDRIWAGRIVDAAKRMEAVPSMAVNLKQEAYLILWIAMMALVIETTGGTLPSVGFPFNGPHAL